MSRRNIFLLLLYLPHLNLNTNKALAPYDLQRVRWGGVELGAREEPGRASFQTIVGFLGIQAWPPGGNSLRFYLRFRSYGMVSNQVVPGVVKLAFQLTFHPLFPGLPSTIHSTDISSHRICSLRHLFQFLGYRGRSCPKDQREKRVEERRGGEERDNHKSY